MVKVGVKKLKWQIFGASTTRKRRFFDSHEYIRRFLWAAKNCTIFLLVHLRPLKIELLSTVFCIGPPKTLTVVFPHQVVENRKFRYSRPAGPLMRARTSHACHTPTRDPAQVVAFRRLVSLPFAWRRCLSAASRHRRRTPHRPLPSSITGRVCAPLPPWLSPPPLPPASTSAPWPEPLHLIPKRTQIQK
jgi:hypothetical protein